MMRLLLMAILVAAAAWSGYWFLGARTVEGGLTDWLETRRDEGWQADYASLNTAGFPNRFDTTLLAFDLADRDGMRLAADRLQIFALSYRPNHIIANGAGLTVDLDRLPQVTANGLEASAVFKANTALSLDRTTLILKAARLGDILELPEARLALRQSAAGPTHYDLALEAPDLRPSDATRTAFGLERLPETLARTHLEATIGLDAPIDRHAAEGDRPRLTSLAFQNTELRWGDMALRLDGALEIDRTGTPKGRLQIRAENWPAMVEALRSAGLIPADRTPPEIALSLLAQAGGDATTIDLPLSFQKGFMSFGPVPLGPAPKFDL